MADWCLYLYVFLCISIAFICKGLVGFGDPLIYNPLLSIQMNNSSITPTMVPVNLVSNVRMVIKNRRSFDKTIVIPIAVFVLLGCIPGSIILKIGAPMSLKLVLGLLIIGIGIEMWTRKPSKKHKKNMIVLALLSFCSGITAGLYGIDLFFVAYLERVSDNREYFRANMCFVFLVEGIFRIIMYVASGIITLQTLIFTCIGIPAMFIGMYVGGLLDKKVNDKLARKFIIIVFILGGISTTIAAATAIWG